MPLNRINHAAAFVAAIVFYLWGWLWYTIFGNQWLALIGKTRETLNPTGPVPYVIGFLMALLLAYGASIALSHDDERTVAHGAQFGLFMGLVFFASTLLTEYLFEGRPLGLWLLNAAYPLIGFMLVGAIIGGWKKRTA